MAKNWMRLILSDAEIEVSVQDEFDWVKVMGKNAKILLNHELCIENV